MNLVTLLKTQRKTTQNFLHSGTLGDLVAAPTSFLCLDGSHSSIANVMYMLYLFIKQSSVQPSLKATKTAVSLIIASCICFNKCDIICCMCFPGHDDRGEAASQGRVPAAAAAGCYRDRQKSPSLGRR